MHKPPVDLKRIVEAVEVGWSGYSSYLENATGEVHIIAHDVLREIQNERLGVSDGRARLEWTDEVFAQARRILNDRAGRFHRIPHDDLDDHHRDMADFIADIRGRDARAAFQSAAKQSRLSRGYDELLRQFPEERQYWWRFRRERIERRAHDWLTAQGISVAGG